jgi:hypothetical protein
LIEASLVSEALQKRWEAGWHHVSLLKRKLLRQKEHAMKLVQLAFSFLFVFNAMTASAEELRIDGSSEASFARSMSAIAKSLTPEEREPYKRGLMNIVLAHYPPAANAEGAALVSLINPAIKAAHTTLNGMTKDEIVARGRELLKSPLLRAN